MPDELVIATANPHKVEELREILAPTGLRLRLLSDLEQEGKGSFPEPAETGATFEENAAIKAVAYARRTGLPCLADDSGLVIDALGGRPGVISSHYSTDGRDEGIARDRRDEMNNARVLRELDGVPPLERTARFVCVMVVAAPVEAGENRTEVRIVASARGTFEGRIGIPPEVPRGSQGFGYDPIFLVAPDFTRTGAELAPHEKNVLSHRARAARALLDLL